MKTRDVADVCRSLRSFAFLCGLLVLLGGCSTSQPTATPTPTTVQTAMPVQKTFHTKVAAFGRLAADGRTALTLSLPKAGEIMDTRVIAGQSVKRGEPLSKFATDPAARNAYLTAQNAVKIARANLAQAQRLHAGRLATTAQLDAARQALADARTALAAQAKLGGAQAVTILKAPVDGVVTALLVRQGQHVPAGTNLIDFSPRTALAAQLGVEPAAAASVRTGMPVSIQPVYGAKGADPLSGTVATVGHAVNPTTHLVDVAATLAAPAPIAAGSALSASISTSSFKAWAVPRDALESDSHGDFIYQVEGGKAKRVDVKVLAPDGSPIGVAGAIDPHAPVITLGSYEVSNGERVKAEGNGSAR